MKKIFILICLQGFVLCLFGQNDYLLLSRARGKTHQGVKEIHEGKKVRIISTISSEEIMRGKLEILNDSVLSVGGDSIFVNKIKKISVRTSSTYFGGGFLIAGSLGIIGLGIYVLSESLPLVDNLLVMLQLFGCAVGLGSIVIGIAYTVGGILVLSIGKSYKAYGKYAYSIRVAHDQTIIPTSDNLASFQQKY